MRGEIKAVFGGQERAFKFGMLSSTISAKKAQYEGIENSEVEYIACMLYGGLMARPDQEGLPKDLSINTVLDWMDDCEPEALADLIFEAKKVVGLISRLTEILAEKEEREASMKAKAAGTKKKS